MYKSFCHISVLIITVFFLTPLPAQDFNAEIDALMDKLIGFDQFSGTVLVAKDGQILYSKAFGEANKDFHVKNTLDTKFNIGSIGKTFTGISIMQLQEKGLLKVTDPVIKHLPDFPYGDKIQIHHLLTHTSGTSNYFAHPDWRTEMFRIRSVGDALPLIYDQELRFETPGEQFSYSNSGIVILGTVVEKLSGTVYVDYIRENILKLAGMKDTGINYLEDVIENRAVGYTKSITGKFTRNIFSMPPANADGGIETTALDMLKYNQALYGTKLLSEDSKKQMYTPFKNEYGYCWGIEQLYDNLVVGHGGGAPGVSAMFRRYLNDRYTIIVLSNYSGAASPVANTIEAIVFGQKYPEPQKNLGEYLYEIVSEKGATYLAENFDQIIKENNYTIRSSNLLNMLGYALLQGHMPEAAIIVFQQNIRLFPDEANPYDSLAEVYMMTGDLKKSQEYYNKALKVDTKFDNAKQMLKKLDEMDKGVQKQ